ncbi:MAG TPA: hypothetical protein VK616_11675, partial [Flavitalea sp.]|nr:hypothetical protein [Flavitalea sp.]
MKNLLLLLYSVCVWECTFSQENASLRSKTPLDFRLRFNLENDSSVVRLFDTSFLRLVPGKALREYLRTFKDKFGYLNALSLQNSTTTEDQYAASFTLDSNFIMRLSVNRSGKISSMFIRPKVTSDTSVKHTNNIWLKKFNLNIPGSILIPPAVVHPPIVIFVAGSGPTDRNGNNEFGLRTNAYLKISTALLEKGIGSLRYDKRLSGEIYKVDERSVLVDSLVDDLRGWINKLRIEYPNSKIVIFG